MTKDLFDKYIWLVDTIHRAGRITLREINEKWAISPLYDGADIPRRTFNNWKDAIQQAFDINIECKRTGGYHYYIENPEDLENSTTRSWLLNTFTVKNIISESRGIRDRILLENVPSGQAPTPSSHGASSSSTRDGTSAATAVKGTPCAHSPWTAS